MFKLNNETISTGNSLPLSNVSVSNINNNRFFTDDDSRMSRYNRSVLSYCLKSDSQYIPIICAINDNKKGKSISKDEFKTQMVFRIKNLYKDLDLLEDIDKDKFEINLDEIYNNINTKFLSNYSNSIVITGGLSWNGTLKQSILHKALMSNTKGSISMYDRAKCAIHPFYYVYNERLMFTLVVKKEHLIDFKQNLTNDVINPKHVEIWIDKEFIKTKDRKMFHKYIREKLMMKLTLEGFLIKEKDCILEELTYIPKFKFKKYSDISKFKENVNKFLLS